VDLEAHLLTDEAAKLADVTEDRIRRWASRYPTLMPVRSRDWRGRPRYRAGDVLDVEHATRTGARLLAS
jgi:DNA-binding transcriptional MerR regulator